MGQLTTHVLDTANGCPGSGIKVDLFSVDGDHDLISSCITNSDGRCDQQLLAGDNFSAGIYELVFHIGAYFTATGAELDNPPFLDQVVIRFGIASEDQHYHVPLLVSPWAYSTYRGS